MKKRMKQKSKNAISIIGGADGPTSIFIAGHSKKQPLKIRIKNSIYRYKRKKVEKTIVANPHSLSETVRYAKDKYELTETAPADREYIEQIKCLKESLILQYEPELLGEMKDIPVPDFSNEASVKEYWGKIKTRSEMIAEMPDSIIPMDFHLYKIRIDDDFLEMEIDYTWNIFGMSYSGNKAVMKKFKKISRDLYSYYGVTEEDIKSALECYDERYNTFPLKDIEKLTNIRIERNKRNGRKQDVHLERARAVQMIDYPNREWINKEGAPTKQSTVQKWRLEHPDGKKADCIRDTGLDKKTVYKWWNNQ
jgi:hypothetical protein